MELSQGPARPRPRTLVDRTGERREWRRERDTCGPTEKSSGLRVWHTVPSFENSISLGIKGDVEGASIVYMRADSVSTPFSETRVRKDKTVTH